MTSRQRVERLLPGGYGCVIHDQQRLLIPQTVPGDEIAYEVSPHSPESGVLLEVLQPSDQRCAPPCSLASRCGGCALQAVERNAQAKIKSQWVKDALHDVWHDHVTWTAAEVATQKRRRVRWHLNAEGQPGFFAPRSHQLIPHQQCMALQTELNALLAAWPTQACIGADSCYALALADGIHAVIEYQHSHASPPDATMLPTEVAGVVVQWWWRDQQGISRPLSRPAKKLHDYLPSNQEGLRLNVGPDDFVQGNAAGNQQMIEQLIAWCKQRKHRRIVDLFSGIGNLSLPLAAIGCQVEGYEVNAASVRMANHNAKQLNLNARYHQADLHGRVTIDEAMIGADCLILDPPRKGARQLCRQMNRLLPRSIIMVHCDPASAKRDADLLASQGYQLNAARALDLFPYSGHVECLSYWH